MAQCTDQASSQNQATALLSRAVESAAPSSAQKSAKPAHRFISSLTLQLLAMLAVLYIGIWNFYPWRPLAELDIPAWMLKYAANTAQIVAGSKAQVIILGSSLIDAPRGRLKRDQLYQEELSTAWHKPVSLDVSSVPGAMMSDQAFVVEKLVENGKKPELLVVTYAPREFMDNEVGDKLTSTPTRTVVTFINRRQSLLPRSLSAEAFAACAASHSQFCDLVRRHVLRQANQWICRVSGHPLTLWEASHGNFGGKSEGPTNQADAQSTDLNSPDSQGPAYEKRLALDLQVYQKRYNPFNEKRMNTQLQALDELLATCASHNIAVQLVGMPISPANKNILGPGIYELMDKKVRQIASKYGTQVDDINQMESFEQTDFRDSVHLSKTGSLKFLPLFNSSVVPGLQHHLAPLMRSDK
ncbi:MAG: hypothetical protein JSS86_25785 [Cyanobacteria bacterium SZAS LIN-2]|nr:hypothetical protein [Cyanobacteria bacterium SZAS LIN-2]